MIHTHLQWPRFECWRLFSQYPALDRMLQSEPAGQDIVVPRQGCWRIRPAVRLTVPENCMVYTNHQGAWLVSLHRNSDS